MGLFFRKYAFDDEICINSTFHMCSIWKLKCAGRAVKERRHIVPSTSGVGGLCAPYEKASHVHEMPVVNWLLASGCHPFGMFSNTSRISQLMCDIALVYIIDR